MRDSAARAVPAHAVCLYAACAQPTGADPIILMVETYSERADAIQNMAIRGPGGTLHQTHLSTVGIRGEDLIPGSYVRTRWRPTQSISRAHALCGDSWREWNVYCRRRAAIPFFCFQRYGLRAELQLNLQWRPTLREWHCDASLKQGMEFFWR